MHETAPRAHGGIGFAIDRPTCECSVQADRKNEVIDNRTNGLTEQEKRKIVSVMDDAQRELGLATPVSCTLTGDMLTHYGMGSGTAIRLACLEGLLKFNGIEASDPKLQTMSRRGGVSGIGLNTYFGGQFVFDLGVTNVGGGFLPSSAKSSTALPLLLGCVDMPDWKFGICIHSKLNPQSTEQELEFFKANTPLPASASYEAAYKCLFGVYAAVLEENELAFDNAIKDVQTTEWKARERALYGPSLSELESALYRGGAACVGMSSLGPLLFFRYENPEDEQRIREATADIAPVLHFTSCNNSGRSLGE